MNKPLAESDLTTPKVTTGPIAGSHKIYARPDAAPDLKVPLREIVLDASSGEPPLPVYDPSGPYTDPDATIDVESGLQRTRIDWVRERGGVEEYDGRPIQPVDNGNVTGKHLARNFPNTPQRPTFERRTEAIRVRGNQATEAGAPSPQPSPRGEGARTRRRALHPPHPAGMGAGRRHHQGNDLHRRARESRPQEDAGNRAGGA